MTWAEIYMYGLSYCRLELDFLLEIDINILSVMLRAEMDKEVHKYDLEMRKLAWQTAYLMNATGNFKTPVKPEKLYVSILELDKKKKPDKQSDIQTKRDELLKIFNIKN